MNDAQHGFLKGRSCITYLLSALNIVNWLIDDDEDVDMCFLGFSKFFDVVKDRFLHVKLPALRVFALVVGDVVFEETVAYYSEPQGSVIEPPLFQVMANYLPVGAQLFCQLLPDNTAMGSKSMEVDLIQRGLDKTTA